MRLCCWWKLIPIANVVSIPIIQCHSNATVQKGFQGLKEVWEDEVPSLLEGIIYLEIRVTAVVEIDAEGILCRCQIEEIYKVTWRRWVVDWMADVVL